MGMYDPGAGEIGDAGSGEKKGKGGEGARQ